MSTVPEDYMTDGPWAEVHSGAVLSRNLRRQPPARPAEVFLVWLREGKYGDAELMAVRASHDGAAGWCNDHRKLHGADPIQWRSYTGAAQGRAWEGTSRRHRTPGDFSYYIESFPLGD